MTCSEWRIIYEELADRYFEATGELAPAPVNPKTGKRLSIVVISPERLKKWYLDDNMRLNDIGVLLNCSASTVSNLLKRAGIEARKPRDYPRTEAQKEVGRRSLERYRALHPKDATKASKKGGITPHEKRMSMGYEFGGAESRHKSGYIVVYAPEHPRANKAGTVPKHTLVMERYLGRYLEDDEVVHHINHIRDDNRIENLQLMKWHDHCSMHAKDAQHKRGKKRQVGGDP